MDNNKKQNQTFTRSKACQPSDLSNRKSSTDSQVNKPWPRNSRRREQPSAARNDTQRNAKQYPVKNRPYVDKRPRPRGGGSGGGVGANGNGNENGNGLGNAIDTYDGNTSCFSDDIFVASTGLATVENLSAAAPGSGAVAKKVNHTDYELNSVYSPGSKKQNLNHLLNFHYAPRESDYSLGSLNVFGRNNGGGGGGGSNNTHRHNHGAGNSRKHKYNKEQFLQANFQFVIKSSAKPKVTTSPDTLIDWNSIEQINIQTTEEPQCPICLYPPIAAKLTRCGHVYCWPCILHYLALSDKTWRKCPICYEAIHIGDLRSTTIAQQRLMKVGDQITFHLMRRKKGSMFIEKFKSPISNDNDWQCYPLMSSDAETKLFSKLLIAKRADILNIIERERRELITDEDPLCPEYVFIQQALDLLKEREEKLNAILPEVEEEVIDQKPQNIMTKDGDEYEMTMENVENNLQPLDNNKEQEIITTEISSAPVEETTEAIPTAKYYYFYQSQDGQNIFLHPLNVKMLQACYNTLDCAPLVINAQILQMEHHSMDEDRRRKFTCLGHLPLTCQFAVVEVDLQPPIVSGGILKLFKEDLLYRKKERQRRDREERKREKRINELNDRQMGKLIASTANINISCSQEFPMCGFEESLPNIDGSITDDNFQQTSSSALATAATATIATPKLKSSYSSVAVIGESPTTKAEELWPTLSSPIKTSSNMYQELSSWGSKPNTITNNNRRTTSDRSSECESVNDVSNFDLDTVLSPLSRTDLGDVLAMAISQKKQNTPIVNNGGANGGGGGSGGTGSGNGNKKTKKTKKMLPLFSTGINYNGH